jgi:hypothetical protein
VRFCDDGGVYIGGDQRRAETDPNHLKDVGSHFYQSKLRANLVERVPCRLVVSGQKSKKRKMLCQTIGYQVAG